MSFSSYPLFFFFFYLGSTVLFPGATPGGPSVVSPMTLASSGGETSAPVAASVASAFISSEYRENGWRPANVATRSLRMRTRGQVSEKKRVSSGNFAVLPLYLVCVFPLPFPLEVSILVSPKSTQAFHPLCS